MFKKIIAYTLSISFFAINILSASASEITNSIGSVKEDIINENVIGQDIAQEQKSEYYEEITNDKTEATNIFENRYKYTQELIRMGAKIAIEGKTAVIKGVRKLYGTAVKATDLRGGAALVLAGIAAKGITNIEDIEYILRGYEKFDEKIQRLGIDIKLENLV